MKQVIIALYPRILATSVALSMDVLEGVSQGVSAQKRGRQQINFRFAATSTEAHTAVGGLSMRPDMTLEAIDYCDMLLLPALWRNPLPVLRQQQAWLPLLQRLHRQGTIICSAGTASCFMAEAGLLNGKAATTHWNYFDAFKARYPEVNLKRRHLITQADNLYCAGSVNSIADLMLHIAEEWFGQRIARAVENQFSPETRRPFRAHAFQSSEDASHHDELVLDAQQWLQDNLHRSISIAELATVVDCAYSTLSRRFKIATGKSPLAYLQSRRIASARELLRMANLSVGEVAWQVGFQDVSYFTSLFRREVGITPARYRNSVRGKLFTNKGVGDTCARIKGSVTLANHSHLRKTPTVRPPPHQLSPDGSAPPGVGATHASPVWPAAQAHVALDNTRIGATDSIHVSLRHNHHGQPSRRQEATWRSAT